MAKSRKTTTKKKAKKTLKKKPSMDSPLSDVMPTGVAKIRYFLREGNKEKAAQAYQSYLNCTWTKAKNTISLEEKYLGLDKVDHTVKAPEHDYDLTIKRSCPPYMTEEFQISVPVGSPITKFCKELKTARCSVNYFDHMQNIQVFLTFDDKEWYTALSDDEKYVILKKIEIQLGLSMSNPSFVTDDSVFDMFNVHM